MTIPNADEALERLKQGNERFQKGETSGPGRGGLRSKDLLKGQSPFAIILSCSDSRVPTEIVFDAGLGDLFVVRVAGNVASPSSIASIEYAVAHLGTKLIVVMAHQSCGAVGAAMEGGAASENLSTLLSYLQPALDPPEQDVDVVARRNARVSAQRLVDESDIIREATEDGDAKIVTAFCHFPYDNIEFD